ncbi:MAG: GAF domain-containing protein [Bacteroidales bacterium]|nr:GAF domain-containing protein [Bacteroidales bacterium]MDT8432616.1 GAF domain-containing protein [Bacteroidales bacterium]
MRSRISILFPGLVYAILLLILLSLIVFLRDADDEILLLLSGGAVVIVVAALVHFITGVFLPLHHLRNQFRRLKDGEPLQHSEGGSSREFRQMEEVLQEYADRRGEIIHVLTKLSEGNIDEQLPVKEPDDALGKALALLGQSIMRLNIESRKRRKLDEQQNWASKGMAKFGELMRDAGPDPGQLSSALISELARYLEVEAGALFLLQYTDKGKPCYVLQGAHACDDAHNLKKSFDPGEGLVGRCALGRETIVLTDLPEDYIRIRSGLGAGDPATIILVPVVFDGEVLGVIELATFSIVKQYKIEFLGHLGNSMGASFSKLIPVG